MRLGLLLCTLSLGAACSGLAAGTSSIEASALKGWTLVTPGGESLDSVAKVQPDGTIALSGKPTGYLLAPGTYSNAKIHVEWRWPANAAKNSNSGVLVDIASGPVDRGVWPVCFQVQTKLTRGGDLLPMAGATFAEALSTPPGAKTPQLDRRADTSEKPLGEWNTCDIVCKDGTIECSINGVTQNRVTGCKPASGAIGIQLEGTPFDLRNVRITPGS